MAELDLWKLLHADYLSFTSFLELNCDNLSVYMDYLDGLKLPEGETHQKSLNYVISLPQLGLDKMGYSFRLE